MRPVLAAAIVVLLGSGTLGTTFLACDLASTASVNAVEDAGEDDADKPPYNGTAKGDVPLSEGGTPFQPIPDDAGPIVVDKRCCNLTFAVTDPTNDETAAALKGDFAPLDGKGVSLAWVAVDAGSGEWRATACIPVNTYVRYGFSFEQAPADSGVFETRVNPNEPTVADGVGGLLNTFGPVTNCSEADASTGMTK